MKAASKEQEEEKKQDKSVREEMEEMKQRIGALEQVLIMSNMELYEPIYGHRVQATVSLMIPIRDALDRFVQSAIFEEAKNTKGEVAKREFEGRFENKRTYLQLMQSHDPIVERILTSAEKSLLAMYEAQGISITKHVDVKRGMRLFKRMIRIRNQTAHIFDYDFEDANRASIEEKKDAWTVQAKILKDIKKALNMGWLPEFMDPEEEDEEGLLHLQLQSKIEELEAMSHCTLDELADMPYRAVEQIQKRRKVARGEEGNLQQT